ncbi:MAG: ACT domain-containing protein, partial [Novosphingobium sp.]|nr:ACT domain-containing protein [Novosphingobium sp.]
MAEAEILTLSCRDKPGITARVTSYLFEQGCNVLEAEQFNDQDEGAFFMRVEFHRGDTSADALRSGFAPIAAEYGMSWTLRASEAPRKVLIMVSKFDHCLADLLYRSRIGEFAMDPVAIVCNHPREALVHTNIRDIPFHHLPITKDTKPQQEAQ